MRIGGAFLSGMILATPYPGKGRAWYNDLAGSAHELRGSRQEVHMRRTAEIVFAAARAALPAVVSARRESHLILHLLALTLAMLLAACAGAAVIVVNQAGGGDFLTVQEGVDAAANGDTVQVMAAFYTEQVVVDGKCLTFEGSGPSGTAIFWDGAGPTLEFINTPSPGWSHVRNINFARSFDAASGAAAHASGTDRDRLVDTVRWTGSMVVFDGAVINGGAIGVADVENHMVDTGVSSHGSTFDWLIVAGDRYCTIDESFVFEGARFSGWYEDAMTMAVPFVTTTDSYYGSLELPMLCYLSSFQDSIDQLEISGASETSCTASFQECGIGNTFIRNDNTVAFYGCTVNEMAHTWSTYPGFRLTLEGCLIGYFSLISQAGDVRFVHNTFDGWFYCQLDDDVPGSAMRSNVFTDYTQIIAEGGAGGDPRLPVTHNLFMDDETYVTALYDSLFTNLWYEDPRFCSYSPDRGIEDCSPCIGAAHDGGIIGAFGIGCDCTLVNAVEEMSWGAIKALYR